MKDFIPKDFTLKVERNGGCKKCPWSGKCRVE